MPETQILTPQAITGFAASLRQRAGESGFRAVLLLSGEVAWCRQQAGNLLDGPEGMSPWWVGQHAPASVQTLDWARVRTRLGMETDLLVIDAFDGFDAEGFGALCGTVRAGGLLILLAPPLPEWPRFADPQHARMAHYPNSAASVSGHFLTRLVRTLTATDGIAVVQQSRPLPELPASAESRWQMSGDEIYATAEQRHAVEMIREVAEGHQRRPLVLSADRGRGKSAALGIAAAQLMHGGMERILVTAPRIDATGQLFTHAQGLLSGCETHRSSLTWQGRQLEFVAPDALLHAPRQAQLLLVDEAAAIPTPLLEGFLEHYPRIVFATTIHGYEGTGRGFALRFRKVLDTKTPQWQALHLSAPVRWAEGDPLERLSFAALLLDAEPVDETLVNEATVESCRFERLEPADLLENETDLNELFGLLVLAHYRTSPNDLRQLLDGPDQVLYVLRYAGHIVATALLVHEGELEPELAHEVWYGRRRVQGHLLAQSLANHAGFPKAAELSLARVMRIAVHPALQRRGLGGFLLHQVREASRAQGIDLLGASFGATAELLKFWLEQGLLPLRVGLGREASSGSHAVMVLAPLSERGEALFAAARARFAETLPELLAEPLASLDIELAEMLLTSTPPQISPELDERDWADLESFSHGLRGYENCMVAIRKLVMRVVADQAVMDQLDERQRSLLEEKVLQRHSWPQQVRRHGFAGRRQALSALRESVALLLRHSRRE